MGKITKNMTFSNILEKYPETAEVLFDAGMHCVGCPMSSMETLEEGCLAHGLKTEEILKKMNKIIEKKKK